MVSRVVMSVVAAASACALAGCQSQPSPSQSQSAAPAASESHAGHSGSGRVYFVEPKDGATIKSFATFQFGSDSYEISPVPKGDVKEARAGMGHYHLGVDTDCLPTGTVIPKADPWIHFGDGKNMIEMQLKPGPHKFSLQAGDDLHRTVEGLCQTINVTVAE